MFHLGLSVATSSVEAASAELRSCTQGSGQCVENDCSTHNRLDLQFRAARRALWSSNSTLQTQASQQCGGRVAAGTAQLERLAASHALRRKSLTFGPHVCLRADNNWIALSCCSE